MKKKKAKPTRKSEIKDLVKDEALTEVELRGIQGGGNIYRCGPNPREQYDCTSLTVATSEFDQLTVTIELPKKLI